MKKTVMIIDDQPMVIKMLSQFLSPTYNVIGKQDARDAVTYFAEGHNADAVISDIMMPAMNGTEFLEATEQLMGDMMPPVMMVSSVEQSSERLKCFKHGAKDYMVKPFNPEELLIRLGYMIKN